MHDGSASFSEEEVWTRCVFQRRHSVLVSTTESLVLFGGLGVNDGSAIFSGEHIACSSARLNPLYFSSTNGPIYGYPRRLRLWLSNNCW